MPSCAGSRRGARPSQAPRTREVGRNTPTDTHPGVRHDARVVLPRRVAAVDGAAGEEAPDEERGQRQRARAAQGLARGDTLLAEGRAVGAEEKGRRSRLRKRDWRVSHTPSYTSTPPASLTVNEARPVTGRYSLSLCCATMAASAFLTAPKTTGLRASSR